MDYGCGAGIEPGKQVYEACLRTNTLPAMLRERILFLSLSLSINIITNIQRKIKFGNQHSEVGVRV